MKMNIPGHGQVIDPIEIATRRAKRQKDLNVAFNQMQMREVNAERKAALPGKKLNKAQRRAAKNARALEVQKVKEQGALLAREEAEKLKAQQAAQQVVQSRSISGTKKGRNSRIKTKHPGGFDPKKGIFTVTTNFDEYLTIPDPATMKPGSLEAYARNKVLRPRFGEQGRVRGTALFEEIQRIGGYEGMGESELERVLKTTIEQTQDDLLREHIKGLRKQYGPAYRAHLRDIATQSIQNDREYFYWNKGLQIDTTTKRPILPISMSEEDALSHISKRVRLDGGTVSTNKNLPGFGQGVKDMVDQSVVSRGQVIDILKGKNQANEFGRILPRSSGAGIVTPPGQLTGMGNIVDLPKNAEQVVLQLDLEDDMRLSYGEALLQSSRMEQQGGNLSIGKQKQLGGRVGLADKQAMMVDHENLVKGYNAALKDLYDADRTQKIAAHAKNRQDLNDLFQADKERKLASHAKNRQDLKDLKEADKQQKLAADAANKERLATERRIQAVLTADVKPQNEYKIYQQLDEAAERAIETTNKAPIAKRTVEKLMESHTLAAGVAAGGLGLIYAANRLRAERQVGRE